MAKERSHDYFWNSDSDRYYDADSMGDWLRPFFRNGIFNGQMQVTANDNMSVTVAAGYGYINGKHRHFLTPTTLNLEIASGTLDRIDSVILRRNDTERRIHLVIEKGGNAKSPVAPMPTREGAVYDLKLADIYIAAGTVKITQAEITDTRMNAAVCGWVAATVKEIDFTQIQAQFDAFFDQCKKEIIDQYKLYLANIGDTEEAARQTYQDMKDKLDALYSEYREYLLVQYNEYLLEIGEKEDAAEADYQDFQTQLANMIQEYQNKFTTWLDHIKGQLSEDAAGRLQNQIDDLKANQGSTNEYVLQSRAIINSLSHNQIAILMELETLRQAETAGTSDNVVIEMFESEVIPEKGYYDSVSKRVYA